MDPPEKSSRPFDLAAEPLEEALGRASALCVEIFRRLEERPVRPPVDRAALERALRDSLPDQGVGLLAALDDFARLILPASMGIPHPLYLGLVNSSPLPGPVLADLLISALNNNGGAFEQSPALTACEDEVVRQLARRFGWPDDSEGLFLPGGSFANLQALVLAREQACPGGGIDAGLRLYTAESAHFSVTRAARIAGFGPAQVVALPGRGRGELDMAALAARLDADRRAGLRPTAVVVTIGTTGTGALDDVAAAAELCRGRAGRLDRGRSAQVVFRSRDGGRAPDPPPGARTVGVQRARIVLRAARRRSGCLGTRHADHPPRLRLRG